MFSLDFIGHGIWILVPSLVLGIIWQLTLAREPANETEISQLSLPITWAEIISLALIIAVAFALRLDGLTFGLPFNFHPDEVPKLNAIEGMRFAGDLNPRYFLHPSLLLYLTHFGQQLGIWAGLLDDTRQSLNIAGRSVSLIFGTLTIPALWLLARSATKDRSTALLSCAMLAVFPLHVTCSRYLKEDALVTFWMTFTAALVMLVVSKKRSRWLLLMAGFCAGVAASSKYTGLVFFLFVLAAPWLSSRNWRPDRSLLWPAIFAVACSVTGFLICTPYALLDSQTFIADFLYEQRHMSKGHMVSISPWAHYWAYHIGRSLIPGIGLVNAVLAIAGAGAALVLVLRDRSRVAFLILFALVLTYLPAEMVNAKPEPQPDRYLMVCMPWCALLIALTISRLASHRYRLIAVGVTLLAVLLPATRSLDLARDLKNDTRTQLAEWINFNIPAGSRIAVDLLVYGPAMDESRFKLEALQGSDILEKIRIGELRRSGYDYLVISSFFRERFFRQKDKLGGVRELFRKLDRQLPILHRVNAPSGPYGFHNPALTLYRVTRGDEEKGVK